MTITSIGTHIKVKDFQKSKQFYLDLGFTPVFSFGPNEKVKESYNGIVFEHGGSSLEVADGHVAVKSAVFQHSVADSKISLMVHISSMKEFLERCQEKKIELAVGPRHYYWGNLEAVVKDPDGVVLVFIAPYSAPEAKAVGADESWAVKK